MLFVCTISVTKTYIYYAIKRQYIMNSDILNLFAKITTLAKEEVKLIDDCFTPYHLSKGSYFLKAGEVNRHIGFINIGLVRYFVYKDGEESTFEFTKEGEFIADYQSFTKKTSSLQNIQAIEDCELSIVNYPNVQRIFNDIKHGNLIGRHIIEHRFDIMVNQLLAIYMQNHEERYHNFIDKYAAVSQRIPQYLIASYVGVKPPSLSRIRKRVSKNIS